VITRVQRKQTDFPRAPWSGPHAKREPHQQVLTAIDPYSYLKNATNYGRRCYSANYCVAPSQRVRPCSRHSKALLGCMSFFLKKAYSTFVALFHTTPPRTPTALHLHLHRVYLRRQPSLSNSVTTLPPTPYASLTVTVGTSVLANPSPERRIDHIGS
jgi:hypothetical protein